MAAKSKRKTTKATKTNTGSGRRILGMTRSPNQWALYGFLVVVVALGGYLIYNATRAASQPELKSDLAGGYCLTDDNNGGAGSLVSAYLCNGGADQYFSTRSAANGPELAVGAGCLVPQGSSSTRLGGPDVAIGSCGSSTADAAWGGLWTTGTSGDGNRYYRNNRTGECLHATAGSSVTVAACDTGAASMQWIPSTYSSSGGGGGSTPKPPVGGGTGYNDPLRAVQANGSLKRERVDQGVDYDGNGPVYAVGPGIITNTNNSGWPEGNFISEELTQAPASTYHVYVYVAETCTPTVSVGEHVTSNTVICDMHTGGTGIETGFAVPGEPEAMPLIGHGCFTDGTVPPTIFGLAYDAVLQALGAPGGTITPGTTQCQGTWPSNWPSQSSISNLF